jgi:uncharacterized repeat protein (TIGR03837 family)
MTFPNDIHIFCRVVDNFGDIGVCWRLARQLAAEHAVAVTLWVDDLASFQKICATIDPSHAVQQCGQVQVRHWCDDFAVFQPDAVADVVVEAFACTLPDAYIAAMAARARTPVWLNLEYLSAESWVDGCHVMASRHPLLPLTKYFFFPGFSSKTGGLLGERDLQRRREAFQCDPAAISDFWHSLGVQVPPGAQVISLFCYPHAPVDALLQALQYGTQPVLCVVPEGVADVSVSAFLDGPAHAGASAVRHMLTLRVLPFLDQPDYDRLLWACDLNFVRGEDSFVRAQWAARPFVWQIYPQQDDAHQVKLQAFWECYSATLKSADGAALEAVWRAWNGSGNVANAWDALQHHMPGVNAHALAWTRQLAQNGDLASNLILFVKKIG